MLENGKTEKKHFPHPGMAGVRPIEIKPRTQVPPVLNMLNSFLETKCTMIRHMHHDQSI